MNPSVSPTQQQQEQQPSNDEDFSQSSIPARLSGPRNTGIDISQAISILSSRAKSGGEKGALVAATPELKKLGQTLDLMNSQQWARVENGVYEGEPCECIPGTQSSAEPQESRTSSREESRPLTHSNPDPQNSAASSKTSKLKEELAKQAPSELLQTLFNLQKERVSAYEKFNSGLDVVLQSGNLSQYPPLTTSITASFAVISTSIREIQQLLSKDGDNGDIVQFIKQLQTLEKEKLNLTAALHLEKIRERNERLELESKGGDDSDDSSDDRVLQLLNQGVIELKRKVNDCVERINDVLEELRYAAFEL